MRQEGCRLPTAGDIAEIKVGSITAHLRFTEMEAFRVAARFLDQRPPSITTGMRAAGLSLRPVYAERVGVVPPEIMRKVR